MVAMTKDYTPKSRDMTMEPPERHTAFFQEAENAPVGWKREIFGEKRQLKHLYQQWRRHRQRTIATLLQAYPGWEGTPWKADLGSHIETYLEEVNGTWCLTFAHEAPLKGLEPEPPAAEGAN